jgi:hypothetical protein
MIRTGMFVLLATALGCSGNSARETSPPQATTEAASMNRLASSVEVEVAANTVRMVLHVTNPTNQPVTLEFSNAQRYDFAVRSADGQEIWRWSKDMGFAAALGSQTIAPGATLQFTETWRPGNRSGSFVAVAELTASNYRLQERTDFQIRR